MTLNSNGCHVPNCLNTNDLLNKPAVSIHIIYKTMIKRIKSPKFTLLLIAIKITRPRVNEATKQSAKTRAEREGERGEGWVRSRDLCNDKYTQLCDLEFCFKTVCVLHDLVPCDAERNTIDSMLLGDTTDDPISSFIFERWR